MIENKEITILTEKYNELLPLGNEIKKIVEDSSITNGILYVITKHTTTGITVNERLECLEDDILSYFQKEFPENEFYYHARFLESYGAMAGNPTGHLKAMLCGSHCIFPIIQGKISLGSAQEIYLAEFDGPQERTISITITGE